jgi:transcriptional regulator with XRE-family HTH domain
MLCGDAVLTEHDHNLHPHDAAGLSQPALAAECQRRGWDIERDTIAKIEGGTRWVCDSELIELARALGRPLVDLFPARVQPVVRGRSGSR